MFDPACDDLAEHFLSGDPDLRERLVLRGYGAAEIGELRRKLAQTIQDAVEDWFVTLDAELAPESEGEGHGNRDSHG